MRLSDTPPAVLGARLVAVVMVAGLLGWILVPDRVTNVAGEPVTKPATALCLVLLGLTLGRMLPAWLARWLPVVSGALAVEITVTWLLRIDSVTSHLLFPDAWTVVTPDGRPLPGTALGILLLSVGALVARPRVATVFGIAAFGLAYVALLGHLYGVQSAHVVQEATSMALPSAVALGLLAVALVARPGMPLQQLLIDDGVAGSLTRRILPWAIAVPPALGWVALHGEWWGWYDDRYRLSWVVMAYAISTVLAALTGARIAARMDAQRELAATELAALNAELSDRVETAVAEVEANQQQLHAVLERYRSVVATMAEGVVLQDRHGVVLTLNEAARRLLGHPAGHESRDGALSVEQLIRPGWQVVAGDGTPLPAGQFPSHVVMRTGRPVQDLVAGVVSPAGETRWLTVNAQPVVDPDEDGAARITAVVTTFADVTDTRETTSALRRSEEQFRAAMQHAPIGMALIELDGTFREVNPAMCRIVGYSEAELLGRTFQQITHPDDLDADLANLAQVRAGELDHYAMEKRYLTKHGDEVWVLLSVSAARENGTAAYFIAQVQDITVERATKEELAYRALHDPLTGLPNRDLLLDRIAHALARSSRTGVGAAVLFLDLDGFKTVNDTYGHDVGDLLLVSVADRLRSVVRPGDTVARLGGDEFVIVAEGLPDDGAARQLGRRLRRALDEPVLVGGTAMRSSASIGVAIAGADDDTPSVLRAADAAMYRAKTHGHAGVYVSERPVEGRRGAAFDPVPYLVDAKDV